MPRLPARGGNETGLPPFPATEGLGEGMVAALAGMPNPAGSAFTTRFEHDLT